MRGPSYCFSFNTFSISQFTLCLINLSKNVLNIAHNILYIMTTEKFLIEHQERNQFASQMRKVLNSLLNMK